MKSTFYRKIMNNGMTVLFEKREIPVVSVMIAIRSGGINELPNEKGISHFIEHMLYKGTAKRNSKQIAEEIEKNGGELNGFTDETITAYWCKMPSKHLNLTLDVLSDMIKNPLFDEKEMEKERKVIFEEIKMRKDYPPVYVFDSIQSELYTGTLGLNLIGTHDTMNKITREKLVKKFNEIYQPNNMILGIVGNADFKDIIKFVEKNFDNKKGKITNPQFSKKNSSKFEKRKGIDQANLVFAYHVPLANDDKCYAAQVLNTLLAGGMSSRLFNEIREKRNLAYSVKGDCNINSTYAYNAIYVGTNKENVTKVKDLIIEEFKKISKGLSEQELNQVKEQLIGNYNIGMEDSHNQLLNLISCEIDGDAREFYQFEKKIKAVKLKDVKNLANLKRYSLFVLVPDK